MLFKMLNPIRYLVTTNFCLGIFFVATSAKNVYGMPFMFTHINSFFSSSTVFIYSMPGYSCNIKERMLYSSCKSRLLEEVEKDYHLEIAKKVTEG